MIWIISPLVLGEISGVFLNTLTSDGKYPVQACENLEVSTQMQLAEKRKLFSEAFWFFHQILNILTEKMIVLANVFPKLETVKIFLTKLSQEQCFRKGFGRKHVKASQLFAKSR